VQDPLKKNYNCARSWWLTPVILSTRRQRSGGLWFKANLGKWFVRPYLEKTLHKKRAGRGLEV
jgi:hypothetical protein